MCHRHCVAAYCVIRDNSFLLPVPTLPAHPPAHPPAVDPASPAPGTNTAVSMIAAGVRKSTGKRPASSEGDDAPDRKRTPARSPSTLLTRQDLERLIRVSSSPGPSGSAAEDFTASHCLNGAVLDILLVCFTYAFANSSAISPSGLRSKHPEHALLRPTGEHFGSVIAIHSTGAFHWVCISADLTSGAVAVYDSMAGRPTSKSAQQLADQIRASVQLSGTGTMTAKTEICPLQPGDGTVNFGVNAAAVACMLA